MSHFNSTESSENEDDYDYKDNDDYDFKNNNDDYNEDLQLKQAIEESLQNAEDEYLALQIKEIDLLEEKIKIDLLEEKIDLLEEKEKLCLDNKKEDRKKSLENILFQFIKLKKIDKNFNKNLLILENIINKYVNCEIDNYYISNEIYKNIFDELKNIRIRENELNLIKKILIKN